MILIPRQTDIEYPFMALRSSEVVNYVGRKDNVVVDGNLVCISTQYSMTCFGPPKGRLAYTTYSFTVRCLS
jgi:hypothetical protein